jgi:hypothetical protein
VQLTYGVQKAERERKRERETVLMMVFLLFPPSIPSSAPTNGMVPPKLRANLSSLEMSSKTP